MKRISLFAIVIFCMGIFSAEKTYGCIGSDCQPCPDGFSVVQKCCDKSDKNDCVTLNNEIEDCGKGKWSEYPLSVGFHSFARMECCKDSSENSCTSIPHTNDRCGEGEFKKYPYFPVKKCCKDSGENDCVIIRAKRRCGEYQLEKYPLYDYDCCNSDFSKCTGYVTDCPRCI